MGTGRKIKNTIEDLETLLMFLQYLLYYNLFPSPINTFHSKINNLCQKRKRNRMKTCNKKDK